MNRIYYAVCITIACTLTNCQSNHPEQKNLTIQQPTSIPNLPQISPNETSMLINYHQLYEKRVTQHYTISPQTKTVITGKQGLRITIEPGKLTTLDDKPVTKNIEVSLIELTNSTDLLRCNAATVSNGKLLASGGSYYISMSSDGKELKIKNKENLAVELPVITDPAMQLFYGKRDEEDNMNWEAAFVNFKQQQEIEKYSNVVNGLMEQQQYDESDSIYKKMARLYTSLETPVYYYTKKTTIKNVIDTINRFKQKLIVDTINAWPLETRKLIKEGKAIDVNYLNQLYGPQYQYLVRTSAVIEMERLARLKRDSMQKIVAVKYGEEKEKIEQQRKYYQALAIVQLGWINCDRFYNNPQVDIPVEPQYVQKGKVEYYFVFKNFNGLIKGTLAEGANKFQFLPINQKVMLLAFTKKDGKYYKSKSEFIITKDASIKFEFNKIEEKDMRKLFGVNI